MASIAAARRRLGARAQRAVNIAHRRRRDSHRGYPDLHQTHTIPVGGSVDVTTSFPRPAEAVTFKFRVDRVSAVADGKVFTMGDQGHVGFDVGRLEVVTGGSVFRAPFVGAPRDSAEIVVALQPVTGQVRAWIDSDCVIAATVFAFPYLWATSGTMDYDSVTGANVRSDLDVFEMQLPRHFNECTSIADIGVCQILFRAAIAANLSTSEFPFLGDH